MAVFSRHVWNFITPSFPGFIGPFALPDFVIDIPMGRIADGGRHGVDRHSTVLASICELAAAPGHPFDFPFIGAASMEVRNVAPRDDGIVSVWVHIDWPSPLQVRLNLLVANG
jgi:hypothetical protein